MMLSFVGPLLVSLSVTITLQATTGPEPTSHQSRASELNSWVRNQASQSWAHMFTNISPPGALPGLIVASLSTSKPDYFYSWTRDTAIVLKEIVVRYKESNDPKLLQLIKQTISATQKLQSSSFDGKSNLGEPKYFVNGTAYTGPWGRPQRDGPALRAAVYIKFALEYLRVGGEEAHQFVEKVLYDNKPKSRSVIKADLDYISSSWQERTFDLWEEVNGFHFFTHSVILRALKDGAAFANLMKDPTSANEYQRQANLISKDLNKFWDSEKGYLRASTSVIDSHGKKSGLDAGTILGCLHAGNQLPSAFKVESEYMVSTFHAITEYMKSLYPINSLSENAGAMAIGRYPEDVYDGVTTGIGNPWFVTTLAISEYLYRLALALKDEEDSMIARSFGDKFLKVAKNYILPNCSMHEQFSRTDGHGIGARDLTWSHAAFLSMDRARRGLLEF